MVKVWWVNQKPRHGAVNNEIVWSPSGDEKWHWKTMWEVTVGDVILHCTRKNIVAVSRALSPAVPCLRPYNEDSTDSWSEEGKAIRVDINYLDRPIPYSDIPAAIRKRSSRDYGPFISSGDKLKQGYFFPVSSELWNFLVDQTNSSLESIASSDRMSGNLGDSLTDLRVMAKARSEQAGMRSLLLGGRSYNSCGICGRMLPNRYLHAAHIKPRHAASEQERRDVNIVMLACVLGCDEAFENGDIQIDERGIISFGEKDSNFVRGIFGNLEGKVAPALTPGNVKYFKYRRELIKN